MILNQPVYFTRHMEHWMVAPCRTEYGTQTLHYAVPKLLNFLIVKELSLDTISYEALRSFFLY